MYKLSLIIFLFSNLYLNAQNKISKQKLYYFISKDSLLGVKNDRGEIIISATCPNFSEHKNHELIKDDLIYLYTAANKEPHSFGEVYDRSGKLLFAPFAFDNGPDYLSEGLMRFVKNGKVGFVNRMGKIVIEAKYDYVDNFDYGIAAYCNGCEWVNEDEHSYVRGGDWGYINIKGKKLMVSKERKNSKDQKIDSATYLPYQFSYIPFEQKIIDSFTKLEIISHTHFVNFVGPLDKNERILHYEIVERPSSFFPYYQIQAFEFTNESGYYASKISDLKFLVTKDGKSYFADDGGEKIPLKKWITKQIIEAKEYIIPHPEALYKF